MIFYDSKEEAKEARTAVYILSGWISAYKGLEQKTWSK